MNRLLMMLCLFADAGLAKTPVFGYSQNPPMMYSQPDGKASGFVAEVLDEAARREGIAFEWRLTAPGVDPLTDNVDIVPAATATPERRKRLYVTDSWWSTNLLLVSREPLDSAGKLIGRVVITTADLVPAVTANLARVRVERASTHTSAFLALCEGLAEAFATDRIILDRLLLRRPKECQGVDLSMLNLPGATLELHILARPELKVVADRLLHGIEALERDGTVSRIAFRHPAVSGGSAAFLASLLESNHQNAVLRSALWLLLATLVCIGAALFWSFRHNVARRRTEAELRRANAALEQTNSDLEQFNYAASHDLSEPLRNMTIYSELLSRRYRDKLDAAGMQYVRVIRDGAQRLEQLLDGLRRYALLSRTLTTSNADTGAVLAEACANLQTTIAQSHVVITSGDLPEVSLEPAWLLQIFQNLLSNAIKYRSPDPLRIHVSADPGEGFVTITVQDNGIGIRPEYHQRVFAVFNRLHGREVPGTGIGLAICRKIVERNGGRIWVESDLGRGSAFRFTIPHRERKVDSAFDRARRHFDLLRGEKA